MKYIDYFNFKLKTMKKFLKDYTPQLIIGVAVIILMFLCSATVRAQDTSKVNVSTVYHDLKSGIDSNAPRIEKAINTLAKNLKVTADQVWDILVTQQKVYAVGYLLILIITIFSWIHFWYRWGLGVKNKWDDFDSGSYVIPVVITLVICLTGTIIDAINFMSMLTGFFNPKFGALQQIAELAQSLKQ